MTFAQSVKTCLTRKYFFKFRGRASRSEFWWFMLFIMLVNGVASLLFSSLPPRLAGSLSLIVSLMLFPANLGVTVRRMHDRNMRGWWLLLPIGALLAWLLAGGPKSPANPVNSLLSLSMALAYLIILCLPGQPGDNRFGPNPLASQSPGAL